MNSDEEILKFIEENEEYITDMYKTYGKTNLDEYYLQYLKEKKIEDIKVPSNAMLPGNLTNVNKPQMNQLRPQFMPRMPMYASQPNMMQHNQMQPNMMQQNQMHPNMMHHNLMYQQMQNNPIHPNTHPNPIQALPNNMLMFQNQMLRNPLIHQMIRNPQAMRLIPPQIQIQQQGFI
jgi:hypothetical protein